jgi:hypothetical protein
MGKHGGFVRGCAPLSVYSVGCEAIAASVVVSVNVAVAPAVYVSLPGTR